MIGKPEALQPPQARSVAWQPGSPDLLLDLDKHLDLFQEPAVVAARGVDPIQIETVSKGLRDDQYPVGPGLGQGGTQAVTGGVGDMNFVEARQAGLEGAQPLLQRPAKQRPIAIASPTDFIDVVRLGSAPGNFSKVKRGILVTT